MVAGEDTEDFSFGVTDSSPVCVWSCSFVTAVVGRVGGLSLCSGTESRAADFSFSSNFGNVSAFDSLLSWRFICASLASAAQRLSFSFSASASSARVFCPIADVTRSFNAPDAFSTSAGRLLTARIGAPAGPDPAPGGPLLVTEPNWLPVDLPILGALVPCI